MTTRGLIGALVNNIVIPMARIARDELPEVPELFPLGSTGGVRSAKRVVSIARGMAGAAAPHRDVFVKGGLPQDFIEQSDSAISGIVSATTGRNLQQGRAIEGRKGVGDTLRAAARAVQVLDGLVRVALAGDRPLLANWNKVKRTRGVRAMAAGVTSIPATPPDVGTVVAGTSATAGPAAVA